MKVAVGVGMFLVVFWIETTVFPSLKDAIQQTPRDVVGIVGYSLLMSALPIGAVGILVAAFKGNK